MKIFIAGDYCPIGRIEEIIKKGKSEEVLLDIEKHIKESDLSIVNLESPLTDSNKLITKSGPNIKSSEIGLKPLEISGVKLATLANNHILDFDEEGVKDTIDLCKSKNIDVVGAGKDLSEARKPFYYTYNDKKIAILNFAENEYCAATEKSYGANPVNLINNFNDINKAKEESDFVIVIAHGGREHFQLPTPNQKERYRFYVDSGADLVVGHHSHCFSGYEEYKEKHIFYSLGNFVFDYKPKYQKGLWTLGYALDLSINFDTKKVDFEIIPFEQGKKENPILNVLSGEKKQEILEKVNELNEIIIDEKLYAEAWEKYIESQVIGYKGMLFTKNMYIRALISRGYLPKFLLTSSLKRKALFLNLFRCETHREIMIDVLNKEL
ncbi:CapA family protein [Aureivirga marina]|uniref:CapA family protein n=1 Tax=Aureivirga marina TaxID=1182451 RepID=UPI0018C979F5|nr:CapA family protein [Aureivirga marina]